MPTLTPAVLVKLERLCKAYKIEFIDDLPQRDWPSCHATVIQDINQLGGTKYDAFAIGATDTAPWRIDAKLRALDLVEVAKRCARRNESTWRYACEHHVLARLRSEVVCQNCRQRLWRSEIEAIRDDSGAEQPDSLQRRQAAREPCRCSRNNRPNDQLEARGINRLFGHREDEFVHHDSDLREVLPKQEKPDAVYGLRPTRNLENLLSDSLKPEFSRGSPNTHIEEILLPSPFDLSGESLLFPFLLLEAKSGKSESDWYSIRLQNAFSIRTFLQTQQRLRKTAGNSSRWKSGPLVWFLACKGQDWSVSLAYIVYGGTETQMMNSDTFRIVELWKGSIDKRDGALQLLIIIDYIFDWARDKYRHSIINELRVIASGENDALSYVDTDVFSTRPPEFVEQVGPSKSEDAASYAAYLTSQQLFTKLDKPSGVIRHAKFIESRYCCFIITLDNVQTFLNSGEPSKLAKLRSNLKYCLRFSNLLDLQTNNDVEKLWTSNDRGTIHPGSLSTMFLTDICFTSYLSSEWHIIRELHVIAVAHDALPTLLGLPGARCNCYSQALYANCAIHGHGPFIKRCELVLDKIKQIKNESIGQALLAAIQRSRFRVQSINAGEARRNFGVADSREFVHHLLISYRTGLLESGKSFLRVSRVFEPHLAYSHSGQSQVPLSLNPSEDGCVLISSRCHPKDPNRSDAIICAYFIKDIQLPPHDGDLKRMIRSAFETQGVHNTTHGNECNSPWNVEAGYGVSVQGLNFLKMIESLTENPSETILLTQGLPRTHCADSQPYILLDKCMTMPWFDIRCGCPCLGRGRLKVVFITYKVALCHILHHKNHIIRCCVHCAALNVERIVQACTCTCLHPSVKPLIHGGRYSPSQIDKDSWAFMATYPQLDLPFRDVLELYGQYEDFCDWVKKQGAEIPGRTTKRSRQNYENGDS